MAPAVSPMRPLAYRVTRRREEITGTVTLTLEPAGEAIAQLRPGQFTMLYAFGIGEVPISASRTTPVLEQTIRAVGAVTRALCDMPPGQVVGVRGPHGTGWAVETARGRDLVFAAGGIGLAPLRPAVLQALADRASYRRICVLVGARTPRDLLYTAELDDWRTQGVQVEITVDRAGPAWTGHVGLITTLIESADIDPANATAFVCGPEIMMRFTAEALIRRGMTAGNVRISLERNMRCGIGWCGHCQLGPLLVCRDGPVVTYDHAAPMMAVKEL